MAVVVTVALALWTFVGPRVPRDEDVERRQ
jgi:hypothetical protein